MDNLDNIEKLLQITVGTLTVISIVNEFLASRTMDKGNFSEFDKNMTQKSETDELIEEIFSDSENEKFEFFSEEHDSNPVISKTKTHPIKDLRTNSLKGRLTFSFDFEF